MQNEILGVVSNISILTFQNFGEGKSTSGFLFYDHRAPNRTLKLFLKSFGAGKEKGVEIQLVEHELNTSLLCSMSQKWQTIF